MYRGGSVKAAAGSWQVAQDCPDGEERLASKNKSLPSSCTELTCGGAGLLEDAITGKSTNTAINSPAISIGKIILEYLSSAVD
jgi:hypothetical protein